MRRCTTEQQLVAGLAGYLTRHGYRVWTEVPNMGQSADLVAARGKWVTFIEAKVHDWGRALRQSRAHELVADYICIAVLRERASERLRTGARARGYGLLICSPKSGTFSWVERPMRNIAVWRPQRRILAKSLREITRGH